MSSVHGMCLQDCTAASWRCSSESHARVCSVRAWALFCRLGRHMLTLSFDYLGVLAESGVHCCLQRASVVCTTLTGVLMRDLRDVRFDVAIIDEAAQVLRWPDTFLTPPQAEQYATQAPGHVNMLPSL